MSKRRTHEYEYEHEHEHEHEQGEQPGMACGRPREPGRPMRSEKPANHANPSLEYTFLLALTTRLVPSQTGARSTSSTSARAPLPTKPTTRLFISPESLVLCLHLLVKPCQFFRLGFTCEPERHLD